MSQVRQAFAFAICLAVVQGLPVSPTYTHSERLDTNGKYSVYWAFNETHITFEVRVQTTGYVGFGISHNGNMFPADVVIGWVKDGHTYFSDRHTTDATKHSAPVLDKSQDWFLLHGEENEFGTTLKFIRKLDTCDDEDIAITDQTVRLIYSYSTNDPASDTRLFYHGAERRGTKSVSLLSSSLPPASFQGDYVKVIDFRARNYVVPSKSTTYACTGIELPNLGVKHHMIEYEAIFTPGNELIVHHMIINRCRGSYPQFDMQTHVCDGSEERPKGWPRECMNIVLWAAGGPPFYFPENAGFPIGGGDGYNFFYIEMHYNNPAQKSGMLDSSGLRIRLTSHLRQHDVKGLGMAHSTSTRQIIPAQETAFITRAYCAPQCSTNGLNEDIKAIAGGQHAHLLGVGVTTRHFRNGVELEPLMDDPYYDFNFQSIRPLRQERVIKPGDSFIVECTLNSMGRTKTTFGGLSTQEEMCMSFFYVYPAPEWDACGSVPVFDTYNITATTENERNKEMYNRFVKMDWQAPGVKDDFKQKLADSSVDHYCVYNRNNQISADRYTYVESTTPYVRTQPSNHTCQTT